MSTEVTIFNNSRFGELRTFGTYDKPMFCLTDVCRMLELGNPSYVKERLDPKGIVSNYTLTSGGRQKMLFVNEPNLYRCLFTSRKEEAVIIQNWVFEEVLPSIRKTGEYIHQKQVETLEEEIKRLQNQAPFPVCKRSITVRSQANFLSTYTGEKIGQNKLFGLLREWKYLQVCSAHYNEPYQKYINNGFFEVAVKNEHIVTLITPKGQTRIFRRYRSRQPVTVPLF